MLSLKRPARAKHLFAIKHSLILKYFSMFKYLQSFLIVCLIFLLSALESAEVKSIQYRSQKITKHQKDVITSNAVVNLADGNVKIEYISPEARTLMLAGDTVYIYGANKSDLVTYNWTTLPNVVRAMLQPSIFSAADFMVSISGEAFTLQNTGKKSGDGTVWTATPKEQKNISKIEYIYDTEKNLVYGYTLVSKEGAVISETQFLDYRAYNDKYYLPSAIRTVIHSAEGLIEETEEFSRIRADGKIDKNIFKF